MLKQEIESISIKKPAGQATHDRTTCQCDFTSPIDIDSVTSLLVGEGEFYYYLTKYDMFLKTILKVIWIDQQEQGNNIKIKVIGKDGVTLDKKDDDMSNQTYIDYDTKIIQKAEKRQTFEEFWKTFLSEFDQIEFSNTDTSKEVARIQKIIDHNSYEHVKRRYKELLLKYHPDKNKSKDAHEKTNNIISAYEFISEELDDTVVPLEYFIPELLSRLWDYKGNDNPESLLSASMVDKG